MPRSPRILVCTCEDISLNDIEQCIEKGYRDVESVKRFTGFGTGICQGRNCMHNIARILSSEGIDPKEPFRSRPPVYPAPLGFLAGMSEGEGDDLLSGESDCKDSEKNNDSNEDP